MPNPTMDSMRTMVRGGQADFASQAHAALNKIHDFVSDLSLALGEISRDEAVDALRKMAVEEIDRLR